MNKKEYKVWHAEQVKAVIARREKYRDEWFRSFKGEPKEEIEKSFQHTINACISGIDSYEKIKEFEKSYKETCKKLKAQHTAERYREIVLNINEEAAGMYEDNQRLIRENESLKRENANLNKCIWNYIKLGLENRNANNKPNAHEHETAQEVRESQEEH